MYHKYSKADVLNTANVSLKALIEDLKFPSNTLVDVFVGLTDIKQDLSTSSCMQCRAGYETSSSRFF